MSGSLIVRALTCRYARGPEVVRGAELEAAPGSVTALLGPNGAGKSTLLKAIVGIQPCSGSISLGGVELQGLSPQERARRVAYVPQRTRLTARLSVRSVVELVRFAHRGPWTRLSTADRVAVDRALEAAELTSLAERPFPELSGGEQQRVMVARALASEAPALLLDEPTSALDVRHVLALHGLLRRLADQGHVVVVVLHHLDEIRRHTDRAVLLQDGRVFCAGLVSEVVAPEPIRAVYGVDLVEGGGLGYRLPTLGAVP